MFRWIYQACFAGVLCSYLPKAVYDSIKTGKYQTSYKKKLGNDLPINKDPSQPIIWLHAVSMGETRAIVRLAKLFKQRHPEYALLISSTTETGHAEAKRSMPFADYFIYLPLDFPYFLKDAMKQFPPAIVLMSESDIWWNFLRMAKKAGAKIGIVNGKLSERSASRLNFIPSVGKRLYENIDLCCAQSKEYSERFKTLDIPQITITGNTKFDFDAVKTEPLLKLAPETELVVLGSTHPREEEALLSQLAPLLKERANLKLVIVPRHPERFDAVYKMLETYQVPLQRYSNFDQDQPWRILLIDAMGILGQIYRQATVAVVCGSFTPGVGGHNIVEPCLAGTPVLFGPYMETQKELVNIVKQYGTGKQSSVEEFTKDLNTILDDKQKREELKTNCAAMVKEIQGATERTYQALSLWLKESAHV
ncbi:MAG: 3-deoxy-D-manno-octulosonic acid transferase [Parachlamydiales bacterium]|jgi:3-deoxy-D-manno-octulosonic-acid transferase